MSFTNPDRIPPIIRRQKQETTHELGVRRARSSGVQVIDIKDQTVSVENLISGLEASGLQLGDALYQPRVDQNNPSRTYHMVRFVFFKQEDRKPSENFRSFQAVILEAAIELLQQFFWKRVRVYRNPYYEPGTQQEIEGKRAVAVNLDALEPVFDQNGRHRRIWQKDAKGNAIGEYPIPIEPSRRLRIENGSLAV